MKIAFFDTKPYDKLSFEKYSKDKDIKIIYFEEKLNINSAKLLKGFDGICIFVNDEVNKDIIDILVNNNIKFILLRCAGFNNIHLKYAFNKIHIYRVPTYSPYAIAEYTFALLLTLNRKIHKAYNRIKDHNFSLVGLTGSNLNNKTIGIIGTGKIGEIVINIAKGFNMNILAYDLYPKDIKGVKYVTLAELFSKSHIISLHSPLTKDTKYMINKDSINDMKDGVIIINTSRGALINSLDLLEGIKSKKIKGAALDVYDEENDIFYEDKSLEIIDDEILLQLISMPNVIITSHQAFLTEEALENIAETTIKNIEDFKNNKFNDNEVCYHCGNQMICKKNRKEKCF